MAVHHQTEEDKIQLLKPKIYYQLIILLWKVLFSILKMSTANEKPHKWSMSKKIPQDQNMIWTQENSLNLEIVLIL